MVEDHNEYLLHHNDYCLVKKIPLEAMILNKSDLVSYSYVQMPLCWEMIVKHSLLWVIYAKEKTKPAHFLKSNFLLL